MNPSARVYDGRDSATGFLHQADALSKSNTDARKVFPRFSSSVKGRRGEPAAAQ
jgi:hypothetical protein